MSSATYWMFHSTNMRRHASTAALVSVWPHLDDGPLALAWVTLRKQGKGEGTKKRHTLDTKLSVIGPSNRRPQEGGPGMVRPQRRANPPA